MHKMAVQSYPTQIPACVQTGDSHTNTYDLNTNQEEEGATLGSPTSFLHPITSFHIAKSLSSSYQPRKALLVPLLPQTSQQGVSGQVQKTQKRTDPTQEPNLDLDQWVSLEQHRYRLRCARTAARFEVFTGNSPPPRPCRPDRMSPLFGDREVCRPNTYSACKGWWWWCLVVVHG